MAITFIWRMSIYCTRSFWCRIRQTSSMMNTQLDKLVRMQHYCCQRDLLDITSNPSNSALFCFVNQQDEDGEVIVLSMPRVIKYFDSDICKLYSELS